MYVTVKDRTGAEHRIEGAAGQSFMLILKNAGQAVAAVCGGNCICATCHVYVDPAWADKLPARAEMEEELIAQLQYPRPDSRLACQLICTEALDGLHLTLAPEE